MQLTKFAAKRGAQDDVPGKVTFKVDKNNRHSRAGGNPAILTLG
jgi:hypothetical protein